MKDITPQAELQELFWDRIGGITSGMLSSDGARPVPMSHTAVREDRALWFITAKGTDIADAAGSNPSASYIVACQKGQLYAAIDGSLSISEDRAKLDEIWSPIASAWFEDGQQDEDIVLVKFALSEGEIWATDGGARFLYEIAKGNLTGAEPDMGEHGTVTF